MVVEGGEIAVVRSWWWDGGGKLAVVSWRW